MPLVMPIVEGEWQQQFLPVNAAQQKPHLQISPRLRLPRKLVQLGLPDTGRDSRAQVDLGLSKDCIVGSALPVLQQALTFQHLPLSLLPCSAHILQQTSCLTSSSALEFVCSWGEWEHCGKAGDGGLLCRATFAVFPLRWVSRACAVLAERERRAMQDVSQGGWGQGCLVVRVLLASLFAPSPPHPLCLVPLILQRNHC